jgi:hypothetical protein
MPELVIRSPKPVNDLLRPSVEDAANLEPNVSI